jgi:serine/threonine protein kinase
MNDNVPQSAKQLFALGSKTEEAVKGLFREHQGVLFDDESLLHTPLIPTKDFGTLATALISTRWADDEAARLVRGYAAVRSTRDIDISLLSRWVLAHPNDAGSALDCMAIEPPQEIEILRVLSRAGSQKLVFLALWRLTQREVVLKRVLRAETADRELQAFPVNLAHRNIIETHRLTNTKGELFLVEKRLTHVLHDGWRAKGVQEGANLLFDMAAAMKYLHDNDRVHGDIKPDNIGMDGGDYVLLDFGICRPIGEFSPDTTATGSLRTRAPELLLTDRYVMPTRVDVWALGATLFAAYVGRYPLIRADERVPRIDHPTERASFEAELRRRAADEWTTWVTLDGVPEQIRLLLDSMLLPDVQRRISSADLLKRVEAELPAFLRRASEKSARTARFSPLDEVQQLERFLATTPLELIPTHKRLDLVARLRDLQWTAGFGPTERQRVATLVHQLGAP